MFRWRVESAPQNYATGPSTGSYGSGNPWSSALWTVLFDINGSGYRALAAHLDGSTGSPAAPIDRLVGIWSNTSSQSLDYITDPNVHALGHNPTAFIGPTGKIMNFHNTLNPNETWANGSSEAVWDYGTTRARTVTQNSCTEYFIDYQIPIALLDASGISGPKITRTTPISKLFCTANSLNNPFQKDCAVAKSWTADATKPAPFGDYLSFNQTEAYSQPIVSSVTATAPNSCPGNHILKASVQDTLALQSGVVVPSVQQVDFYYWYDKDGNGLADDSGSNWTKISPTATRDTGTSNKWTTTWDATSLSKGKYLVGTQALDDNTKLDDGMTLTGVNNRTFSYVSGDATNKIYIGGSWISGQQSAFPTHSPSQTPSSGENWYGNPDVTGQQIALVGTAINACGLAPTIALSGSVANVIASGSLNYTITLTNPVANSSAITVSQVTSTLPSGFSYQNNTTAGTGGLETLSTYEIKLGRSSDFASWRDLEFGLATESKDIRDSEGKPMANQIDVEFVHLGYEVDFEISGLEQAGQTLPVVIPLKPGLSIPGKAVWRKYSTEGWRNFTENAENQIHSTKKDANGQCPSPSADAWVLGLNIGDDCVRLIIQDGGPNDFDKLADGVIRDPSALAVKPDVVEVTTIGKGTGRGGGVNTFLLFVLMLIAFTFNRKQMALVNIEKKDNKNA